MKKLSLIILSLVFVSTSYAQKLDRSVRPKPGPAPAIELGKTESFTLTNGMRVFVVENHKLPMVSASIQLDIDPELEGKMAGYSEFLSELLTAGTENRSKDELNKEIDFIGARISASSTGMFGQSLKKHQNKLLELMSDIAMNAKFEKEEVEKIRKRLLSGLEASKNDPDDMLNNVTAVVNYGTLHPYGEVPTENTVGNVTLEQCNEYYSTYYRPNVAYMAVVGDVTVKEVKPLIEKYFGQWKQGEVPVTKYANVSSPKATNVAFVPRDAAVQSVINVTYPIDLKPGHPDVIKADVANSILGGGSTGRLFLNLREEHAWTYGSYSSIREDDLKGQFRAYAKCRNEVSDSSVAEILKEMKRMREEKVSEEDLQRQITYMSGGFAIGLESPQRVAQYAINIERYDMPKDYYKNYLKNLSAVTSDDILNISKKYIDPTQAHIVVVGSKDEVAKTLTRFDADGKIDYYDNYGNKLSDEKKMSIPSGVTADAVMKKYISAIGGEKAINSIKDIKTVMTGKMSMGPQEIELKITEAKKAPAMYMQTVEIPAMGMVAQKQVFNGTTGYQEVQGQKMDMGEDEIKSMKQEADIYAELHPETYGIKHKLAGMEKLGDADVYVIEETTEGSENKSKKYFDASTGYLLKEVATQSTPQGPVTSIAEYADYKAVPNGNGYQIAYSVTITANGQKIPGKVESVEVNKGIEDTTFE